MFYKIVCTQIVLIVLSLSALVYGIFGKSPSAYSWEIFGINNTGMLSVMLGLCVLSRYLGKSVSIRASDLKDFNLPHELIVTWRSGGKFFGLIRLMVENGKPFDPERHSARIVEFYESLPEAGDVVPYTTPDLRVAFRPYRPEIKVIVSREGHKIYTP